MIGPSVPLFIQGKMQGDAIQGNIIIAVSLVLSFAKDRAAKGIHVTMHMVFLSVGFILRSIVHVFARMRVHAQEEFASLLTGLRSFAPCMLLPVLLFRLLGHITVLLLHWKWVHLAQCHLVLHRF
ncbi:hypothetical protein A2U01_0054959 [Trifolium medium]|uniref:Uncharacterized protein n=1 Tax=Trifolium medium TaxID=97028 RepID=A0A392RC92_9FABA|nr:hypothetical protein [Trifolium medium]